MKFVSWNVNGLRACVQKGFLDFFKEVDADIFCIQETKLQPEQISLTLDQYHQYFNSAEKKGYSGTAVFSKQKPVSVRYDIGKEEHKGEGRTITLEFPDYFLVTVYTPNAQQELSRIDYRMEWEDAFREYLCYLDGQKPVIVCGDMNVARSEIDLRNPKSNRGNAGFSDQEREKMEQLLKAGFTDSFRYLHPDQTDAYTWWSYRFQSRSKNAGWRIDYFLISNRVQDKIREANIHNDILGSDHCPVSLQIDI